VPSPAGTEPKIGRAKALAFGSVLVLLVFAVLELIFRIGFAAYIGPSAFWYGTGRHRIQIDASVEHSPVVRKLTHRELRGPGDARHDIRQHAVVAQGYSKYRPHEKRFTYDGDTGELYSVSINARGFRGRDFSPDKPAGTVRVVTLGASSTFGYHDPDDGTYPVLLERSLNRQCSERRFEVINLGIPHLRSQEILALFQAEGLPLRPDVVTFYEGINDSSGDAAEDESSEEISWPRAAVRWARDRILLVAFVHEIVSSWKDRYSAADVEAHALGRPDRFVQNLEQLNEICRRNGSLLLLAKQQARSLLVVREEIRGVSFAEELERVRGKLEREGFVTRRELVFLTHARVLDAAEHWAREAGVPVVDTLSALDGDRDQLVSWVHLTPRGNQIIAETYAREILKHTCPSASSQPAAGEPQ
jgi:lysophospholipase L1-like esterase